LFTLERQTQAKSQRSPFQGVGNLFPCVVITIISFFLSLLVPIPKELLMATKQPHLRISNDTNSLSKDLASFLQEESSKAIKEHGKFTLAVSGGSLPQLAFSQVVKEPFVSQVDWNKWHVFFVDERYLSLDNSESNYFATSKFLLNHVSIPKSQVYALNPSLPLPEAAQDYEQKLLQVFGISKGHVPQFDLVLCGMGPDGHTASLFPNHSLLKESSKLIAYIEDSPKPPPQRITFTLPLLNNAKNVVFVTAGDAKKETVAQVLEPKPGEPLLPSALVNPPNGTLYWFMDSAASSLLKKK